MIIIELYIIFALTTALMAVFDILRPVIRRSREEGIEEENLLAIYVVFFAVVFVSAPAVFLSCIIPSQTIAFRDSLYIGLFNKD